MKEDLPFPPERYPWPTNEQLKANDAHRDSLLPPEVAADKDIQKGSGYTFIP